MARPLLIVVAAPSGAGKTTLCDMLLADMSSLIYSISCTTRMSRGDEVDGEDYFFLSSSEFDKRMQAGDFLEHAEVHGNRYGTLKDTVDSAMAEGNSVLMDIDVQGARQIREHVTECADDSPLSRGFVDFFIMPPSAEVLRERLEGRGEDSSDVIEERLDNAADEMSCAKEFMHVIVNNDLEIACREMKELIQLRGDGEECNV
jgi:guanylate kinase